MRKRLKVLQVFDMPYATPRGHDFAEEFADEEHMYTERDVCEALRTSGHEVRLLGLCRDIRPLLDEVEAFRPDVVFNLAEVFNQQRHLDKNIAAVLEMLGVPYTGASSGSLFLCNDKALAKKILRFHRVRVPRFQVYPPGRRVWRPRMLKLPCVVKPLTEEASRGISSASVVDSDEALLERIRFIHQRMHLDAIAEEYIEGRELYVTVLGYKRISVLPAREMKFGQLPEEEPRIATYKAKWDDAYRSRWGIKSVFAGKLPEGAERRLAEVCKRAYRALNIESYARFDLRLTPAGQVVVLEPNANPCVAKIDEMAQSAEKVGVSYPALIEKIVRLALIRAGR
ncbi:MAG TPA: hypothetical protein VGB20_07055 [bacterium]